MLKKVCIFIHLIHELETKRVEMMQSETESHGGKENLTSDF